MLRTARHAHEITGHKNLCLAGGVALNCVGNGRIVREGTPAGLRTVVTGMRSTAGRVQGAELADGSILYAPVVVNAAGPWCNAINALAGVELNWTLRPHVCAGSYC